LSKSTQTKPSDIPILVSNIERKENVYLFTPATPQEIARGEYVEVAGLKLSKNPNKHAVIKDVKTE
jgi:hypothetical protein